MTRSWRKKSLWPFTSNRIKAFMRHCSCSFMVPDWYSCVVSICLLTCVTQRIVKGNNNCMTITYSGALIHRSVHFSWCQIQIRPTGTYFDWLTCKHRWHKDTLDVWLCWKHTHTPSLEIAASFIISKLKKTTFLFQPFRWDTAGKKKFHVVSYIGYCKEGQPDPPKCWPGNLFFLILSVIPVSKFLPPFLSLHLPPLPHPPSPTHLSLTHIPHIYPAHIARETVTK